MNHSERREKLLLRVLHIISNKYKNQAVLKGGLALRLFNSPRYTQDIDFVFVTKISRKVIAREIREILERERDIEIQDVKTNSRGVFLDVSSDGILIQVEISVKAEMNLPPETMTTAALALPLNMPAQIIYIMSRAESYSHKIAACLERRATRDLYDISLYEPSTDFDLKTLQLRLSQLTVDRKKPTAISYSGAAKKLKKRAESLQQEDLDRELAGLIPEQYLSHSSGIIRASVQRLCQKLERLDE